MSTFQILSVDFYADDAPKAFATSLKNTGFALIENSPLDQAVIDEAYRAWGNYFHSDAKFEFPYSDDTRDGYISTERSETAKGEKAKDLKEFYHYYQWGRCPQELRALTEKLYSQMNAFAETLLSWVEQEMPEDLRKALSEPLSQMVKESPMTLLRFIHYPPLSGNEDPSAVRAAAHEDINLITILPAATADGLQVQTMEGNWVDVECNQDCIVINTGDMLSECTGGYYRATPHRVINPTGEAAKVSRLSMPLFLHPREDVILSDCHSAKSYLAERLRELGLGK